MDAIEKRKQQIDGIKRKIKLWWRASRKGLTCKELIRQEAEREKELELMSEYIEKAVIIFALKDKEIRTQYFPPPKYLSRPTRGDNRYVAWIGDCSEPLMHWYSNKGFSWGQTEVEAKYHAVQKYKRKYGKI